MIIGGGTAMKKGEREDNLAKQKTGKRRLHLVIQRGKIRAVRLALKKSRKVLHHRKKRDHLFKNSGEKG